MSSNTDNQPDGFNDTSSFTEHSSIRSTAPTTAPSETNSSYSRCKASSREQRVIEIASRAASELFQEFQREQYESDFLQTLCKRVEKLENIMKIDPTQQKEMGDDPGPHFSRAVDDQFPVFFLEDRDKLAKENERLQSLLQEQEHRESELTNMENEMKLLKEENEMLKAKESTKLQSLQLRHDKLQNDYRQAQQNIEELGKKNAELEEQNENLRNLQTLTDTLEENNTELVRQVKSLRREKARMEKILEQSLISNSYYQQDYDQLEESHIRPGDDHFVLSQEYGGIERDSEYLQEQSSASLELSGTLEHDSAEVERHVIPENSANASHAQHEDPNLATDSDREARHLPDGFIRQGNQTGVRMNGTIYMYQ